jgi:hypothetical protein
MTIEATPLSDRDPALTTELWATHLILGTSSPIFTTPAQQRYLEALAGDEESLIRNPLLRFTSIARRLFMAMQVEATDAAVAGSTVFTGVVNAFDGTEVHRDGLHVVRFQVAPLTEVLANPADIIKPEFEMTPEGTVYLANAIKWVNEAGAMIDATTKAMSFPENLRKSA